MKKMWKQWGVVAGVVVLVGAGVLTYFKWFDVYRFEAVTPGVLYRDGMRNTWEFGTAIRRAQPKTVISLVTDAEVAEPRRGDFQGEARLLEQEGIDLVRMPVTFGGPPTQGQIEEFLSIVTDKDRQPVLVHCAQGVVRTGMMVAAYQREVLGYDKERALSEVEIFGKGWQRGVRVREFIEHYYDGTLSEMRTRGGEVASVE